MGVMTIAKFRLHPEDALRRVEAGETVQITRDARVVAELRPKAELRDRDAARRRVSEILGAGLHLGGGPVSVEDRHGDPTP